MKTLGLILILVVLLFSGFYFLRNNNQETPKEITITVSPTQTIQDSSIEEEIIAALSKKNNWDASRIELNVTTLEGNFAKGGVKFKDEMGGGLWFAAKVNGTWEIVYDGNGVITCDMLTNYKNFPKELIPQCWDSQTDVLVTR